MVRIFRKSPLKNEIFQMHVKCMFHKELILDVKTRRKSLVEMREKFLELKTCILKVMIDLKEILKISEEEYAVMNAITISLQPIKVGIERLGRSNAALLNAEGVLIFILDDLWEKNVFFANKLLQSVQQRIEEGRNIKLVGLLTFLNNQLMHRGC